MPRFFAAAAPIGFLSNAWGQRQGGRVWGSEKATALVERGIRNGFQPNCLPVSQADSIVVVKCQPGEAKLAAQR